MIGRLVVALTCKFISVQTICTSYEDRNVGLEPGCLASRLASCLVGLPQQMWISKGEYELFLKC